MKKNRDQGFTLIELIVVLVIVGLLSGMVVPRILGTLTRVELKTAAKRTASLVNQARDLAFYKKKDIKLSFNMDTETVFLLEYRQKEDRKKEDLVFADQMEWVQINGYVLPENVKIKSCWRSEKESSSGSFDLLFFPAGNTTGGTITLENSKGKIYSIQIDTLLGNAQIKEKQNND